MTILLNPVRTRNTRTILVAAAIVAVGGLMSPVAWAGPVEDNHQSCLAGAAGSADSRERRSDHCTAVVQSFAALYDDCMRNLEGSADSLEHWTDHCANEAAGAATND
jgi:hypothetical protein